MLMPGELFFGERVSDLHTLLGSCVAVTWWHAKRRIGGMCHYLLPCRQRAPGQPRDGKFGDEAIGIDIQPRHGFFVMRRFMAERL